MLYLVVLTLNVFRSGSKVMDRSRMSQGSQESSCELREGHEMATDEKYLIKFKRFRKIYIFLLSVPCLLLHYLSPIPQVLSL